MGLSERDRKRILIVDDDSAVRSLYQAIIGDEFPQFTSVDVAINGKEAVDSFQKGHPGVILMDLHMPGMDGLAAFQQIEIFCKKKGWEMPVVLFCTAFTPPDALKAIVQEGSLHSLLRKPLTLSQMVNAIRAAL
jgi:CheY-like chemotaxis protein